jgi:hypothetical protein
MQVFSPPIINFVILAPSLVNYCFAVGILIDKYPTKSAICDSGNQMASSKTTITVSGHNAQWGWEGDKSIWQQYPINIQQEISQAFDAGKKEVKEK